MKKIVLSVVAVIVATMALPAYSSDASTEAECNSFPKSDGADVQAGGALSLSGLGKLAGGEVRGDYSRKDKRLLADAPDTNRTEVVMALLAYHCRRVKGLSEADRRKADQQFYDVVTTLSAPAGASKPEKRAPKASTPAPESAQPVAPLIPPSAKQAASLLNVAARRYKSVLGLPFMAALGGAYIPVIPYELLTDRTMLSMVADQQLMEPVPNLETIPETDTESLAYGMCQGVKEGDERVNDAMTRYGSKIPERLYADIGTIQGTSIYSYYHGYIASGGCDVFLGVIRNRSDKKLGRPQAGQIAANWAIPLHMPTFSPDQYSEYVAAVETLDSDTSSLGGKKESKQR
ncbi:hypothetical protein B0G80_3685 [Paraburkholderia sp. BL6669N2]|uniref:hypothetical protein n=1 Tax=Paraburkholderia sp. BL6669N2 TaxID=1938807 RepID=UPI000E21C510|nr:hypothetical protein [Paraburkholderia sp. BL6669N2]REG60861.1 hypothetical protein B0G80_3685 [Paraburkholderia sp. BL6669N2]